MMKQMIKLGAGAALLVLAAGAATGGGLPTSWGGGRNPSGPVHQPQPGHHPGGGTQVPEPGDVFLFAAGVAGLIIGRRSARGASRA